MFFCGGKCRTREKAAEGEDSVSCSASDCLTQEHTPWDMQNVAVIRVRVRVCVLSVGGAGKAVCVPATGGKLK